MGWLRASLAGLLLLLRPPREQASAGRGRVDGKLNVHLVCHTHDDAGWLKVKDSWGLRGLSLGSFVGGFWSHTRRDAALVYFSVRLHFVLQNYFCSIFGNRTAWSSSCTRQFASLQLWLSLVVAIDRRVRAFTQFLSTRRVLSASITSANLQMSIKPGPVPRSPKRPPQRQSWSLYRCM